MNDHCGYALIDVNGEEYPCDRPAAGWRWYQNVEHEDALDVACEWHQNEGGRRIHTAESKVQRVEALRTRWEAALGEDYCPSCSARATDCDHGEGYHHALSDIRAALDGG